MTAYRHLPASAASVLLGTALLLSCAPKAQAAEKTPEEVAAQAEAELVQKQDTEPKQSATGDAAETTNTEENSQPTAQAGEEPAKTEEKPAKSEQPTVVADSSDDKQEAKVVDSPAPKPQARDNGEATTTEPVSANVKSALDKAFSDFKFLELPIDTTVGKLPDPSELLLKNGSDSSHLSFKWQLAPDVSSTGPKDAIITVTISNDDGNYNYDIDLHTKVNVWQKESDYAMVYGNPTTGSVRNYFMYYDVDLQKVIAKRVFYGNPDKDDVQIDETYTVLSGATPSEWLVFGYTPATTTGNYSDKENAIENDSSLSTSEQTIASEIFKNADVYAYDVYDPNPSGFDVNNFRADGIRRNVCFVKAAEPQTRNVPNLACEPFWLGYGQFDFSDGSIPDPRFFVQNWEMMQDYAQIRWLVPPEFDATGRLKNDPTIEVIANGQRTLLDNTNEDHFANNFELKPTDPNALVLFNQPRQTEKGQLPAPSAFFKRPAAGVDPSTAFWVIKPDVTKAGWTHGVISYAGNRRIVVFLQVNEPAKPQPKPDPEPKPEPKPDPEPEPEPQPDPDPIPVPTPDPLPDIPEEPDKDHDDDKPEDKKPAEKKQTKQTTKTVVTKTSVVKRTVTKPVTQQKRASLPQTGNKGLLVLALGAAISIIGLGLLHKKKA